MSTTLNIKLRQPEAKKYRVVVGAGLLKTLPEMLEGLPPFNGKKAARYVIITDDTVKKIAGDRLLESLQRAGLRADLLAFPAGEKNKNEATHRKLTHRMLAEKCGRDTLVLALGGGVVGDMAGYVAATYMRGVPYVQIPTSFLAMVDSSVGGKVGVDTPYGKNLVGAFWHPQAVIADIDCLKNLPREQLVNGLMESVKIFLTYDKAMFEFTRKNWNDILAELQNRAPSARAKRGKFGSRGSQTDRYKKRSEAIIARSIELKIGVVTRDEFEANERMVVNWGHTIGHAVEHLSRFRLLHGYSVALGMLVESKIAELLGVLSSKDFLTIRESMRQFGIDERELGKFSPDAILKQTLIDKKSANGKVKYVLLEKIGKVKVRTRGPDKGMFGHEVDSATVREALSFLRQGKILKK
jgi:3-dehydroquinate synthase